MSAEATVFDIQKFSIHDGPGIRTIIFLKGCSLRCQWCANPESNNRDPEMLCYPDKCIGCGRCVKQCPANAIENVGGTVTFIPSLCENCLKCTKVCPPQARKVSGIAMSAEDVCKEVEKDNIFYESSGGGITFSGGEPFLWPDFVRELSVMVKSQGFNVVAETCGYYPEENFEIVKDVIDLILFDIKFIDEKKHIHYCGASNKQILSNFITALEHAPLIVRMPVIPDINDSLDDLSAAIDFFSAYKDRIKEINLLPYHNLGISKFDALRRPYLLKNIRVPLKEELEEIRSMFEKEGYCARIEG